MDVNQIAILVSGIIVVVWLVIWTKPRRRKITMDEVWDRDWFDEFNRGVRKQLEEAVLLEKVKLKEAVIRDLIGMTDRAGLAIMNSEE